jgi:molybdopterin-synthase adenylyltransferase
LKQLQQMRVAVVGLGGLGCPASLALASAGVGHLTLVDPDVVEVSNLHRQPWHHPSDVGVPKVESARSKLARVTPQTNLETWQVPVTSLNAPQLVRDHDVVIDGTDSVEVKFLLSDVAKAQNGVVIYGGVLRREGLALRIAPEGPCLRCLFEQPPTDVPTCAQAGVLGPMAGVVGALQAQLALTPEPIEGMAHVHVIDGAALTSRRVKLRRRVSCGACSGG